MAAASLLPGFRIFSLWFFSALPAGAIPEAGKNRLDIKIPFDGVASEQSLYETRNGLHDMSPLLCKRG